ncbi:AAA family ATPase [Bdellovibrionota bacterium FG-1]
MNRYLQSQIQKDLQKKMVFIGGPRQAGKTTLAKSIAQAMGGELGYLNWDDSEDREKILKRELPQSPIWIFDEIHKYRLWRNYLKGLFDKQRDSKKILVTGSARLDYYRYAGDSLQGRYHFLRLHPLSLDELNSTTSGDLNELFRLGGFPEPFLSGERFEADRWSREYRTRLIREDITSVENLHDLGNLELLLLRLPELAGNPLSINALREDLQISFKSVSRWLDILERFYAIFRLSPFGHSRLNAVKKERKHYHFDWNLVKDEGVRFENLVASHLLKWCNYFEDTQGRDLALCFYRDLEQREVDFVVTEDRKPICFVETKLSDVPVSKSLSYLKRKFPKVPAFQIYLKGTKDFEDADGIRLGPAHKLLLEIRKTGFELSE